MWQRNVSDSRSRCCRSSWDYYFDSVISRRKTTYGIYSLTVKPKIKMYRHKLIRLMTPAAFPCERCHTLWWWVMYKSSDVICAKRISLYRPTSWLVVHSNLKRENSEFLPEKTAIWSRKSRYALSSPKALILNLVIRAWVKIGKLFNILTDKNILATTQHFSYKFAFWIW